ncbi:MAG: DEDD exonuclease domain-containing protein [Sporichthyaceae bacterium]|nr:DEDD exonuclease domain-containing protein [Sporichthyaceae bacterium]
MTAAQATQLAIQGTFDELGTPLREVSFVVVDLETTGAGPQAGITEIGAVKVRAGQQLGEFQTLVNPGAPIPPFVAVLTGITDLMVATAPQLGAVLPQFLSFADGCVLVAHNAPFDVGMLRRACAQLGYQWPTFDVVDTALLARRTLTLDEVANCRLATLARFFRAGTTPNHRALADARATVDVLHGLLERVGSYGVFSLEELGTFSARVSRAQVAKRHLAARMPSAPGVYLFKDARGEVLYVGKSRNLRARVRTYFTASETRSRITEMIGLATDIVPIVCATGLEAEVRELRLIAEHKPRYNRRSRFPERAHWLKLTTEAFPRLSLVREIREETTGYLGPFGSRRVAEQAMTALHEAFRIRQCATRLSVRRHSPACVLAELGRCNAPCQGGESIEEYGQHVRAVEAAMHTDIRSLLTAHTGRIDALSSAQRYEEAGVHRDRLSAFVRAAARMQRLTALIGCRQLVAACPSSTRPGHWELAVVRSGRLAGTGAMPPGAVPATFVAALVASAETVVPGSGPLPAALAEETEVILRWLEQPGVRLVQLDGQWALPIHGAEAVKQRLDASAAESELTLSGSGRRTVRPMHRPAG